MTASMLFVVSKFVKDRLRQSKLQNRDDLSSKLAVANAAKQVLEVQRDVGRSVALFLVVRSKRLSLSASGIGRDRTPYGVREVTDP